MTTSRSPTTSSPPGELAGLLEAGGMTVAEQARRRDAVPAARWDRSDALRPLGRCRLAGATVSGG